MARVGIPMFLTLLIAVVATSIYMNQATSKIVVSTATVNALDTINQYKTIRGYHTKNVVKKVKKNSDIKVNFNHHTENDAIPLPATLIQDLSEIYL